MAQTPDLTIAQSKSHYYVRLSQSLRFKFAMLKP